MTFLILNKSTPAGVTIPHLATIFFAKTKPLFSRRAKNPQDILDAQMRREAASRAVVNLLR